DERDGQYTQADHEPEEQRRKDRPSSQRLRSHVKPPPRDAPRRRVPSLVSSPEYDAQTLRGEGLEHRPPPRLDSLGRFALIPDRERDLVLIDSHIEDLVVEKRSRLRLEEDTSTLFLDHLVVLGGQRNDAEPEARLRSHVLGGTRSPPDSGSSLEEARMSLT